MPAGGSVGEQVGQWHGIESEYKLCGNTSCLLEVFVLPASNIGVLEDGNAPGSVGNICDGNRRDELEVLDTLALLSAVTS